jgi:hypothetical protein
MNQMRVLLWCSSAKSNVISWNRMVNIDFRVPQVIVMTTNAIIYISKDINIYSISVVSLLLWVGGSGFSFFFLINRVLYRDRFVLFCFVWVSIYTRKESGMYQYIILLPFWVLIEDEWGQFSYFEKKRKYQCQIEHYTSQ